MSVRKPIGLAALIDPMSTSDFMEHYWARQWKVFRGPLSRLRLIGDTPELATLDGLLRAPHKKIRCWFPNRRGSLGQIRATPSQARQMYNGTVNTVVIDGLRHPAVVAWLEAIARDLGTAQPSVGANVYASPPGAGSHFHFDHQDNFLLQVAGKKEWLVAEADVPYTTRSYFGEKTVSDEMRAIAGDKLPLHAPKRPKKVVLSPGDVLFLPKGTWHSSNTKEDSIGFTLTFPSLNWAEIFRRKLREELLQNPAFREAAVGLTGTLERRRAARAQAAHLREEVQRIVERWSATDLMPPEPAPSKPRRHARPRARAPRALARAGGMRVA